MNILATNKKELNQTVDRISTEYFDRLEKA
jgi:hypothetical protein